VKLRNAETKWDHDRAPCGGCDLFEMHDAKHRFASTSPATMPSSTATFGDEPGTPFDQPEDDQQHEQRDAEPLKLAIAWIGKCAGMPSTTFGQRRQSAAGPVDTTRIREMPITRMMVPVTTGETAAAGG